MTRAKGVDPVFSRRAFLEKMRWAPLLFLPAPLQASPFGSSFPGYNPSNPSPSRESQFPFADFQVTPHYPAKSPVDDLLRLVVPGSDGYVTEKYAFEIGLLLKEWSRGLKESPPAMDILAKFLAPAITASSLTPIAQKVVRTGQGIEVLRRQFSGNIVSGREGWLREIKNDLASLSRLETAEFEIIGIQERLGTAPTIQVEIRYDLVGLRADTVREERIGHWLTEWTRNADNEWRAVRWEAREEP